MKKKLIFLKYILNLVAICVVSFVAYQSHDEFFRVFTELKIRIILLFLLLNFISTMFSTLRWKQLFPKDLKIKYSNLLKSHMASQPFKFIGFGFVGSDLYKSIDIIENSSLTKSNSIILTALDRFISLYSLSFLGLITSCYYMIFPVTFKFFYVYSFFGFAIILLSLTLALVFLLRIKKCNIIFLNRTVNFEYLSIVSMRSYLKALGLGLINHSLSLLSFYLLISHVLPTEFNFIKFLPFGVAMFITEVTPFFGAAHLSSEMIFNLIDVKGGVFLFNDYYLCLKLYQVLISLMFFFRLFRRKTL